MGRIMNNTLAQLARFTVENADLKLRMHKMEVAIDRAYRELAVEEVDPDDCRETVLGILRNAMPPKGAEASGSQTEGGRSMGEYDCKTCGNSGVVEMRSGGSGWGDGGPEVHIEQVECSDCEQCPECDGTGDTGNWYGDPDVPGGTRSLPCDRCRGSGRLPDSAELGGEGGERGERVSEHG